MRWYAERRSNKLYLLFVPFVFSVAFVLNLLLTHHAAAQSSGAGTTIGVTLCASGSTITLDMPVSDSVATSTTVAVSGQVAQASQVEIRIDDAFDNIIPLSMGQSTYSGSVQLSAGTHTIKVIAIDICGGTNGTATSVVTYTPPPQNPSTGSKVPTTAGGGVVVGGSPVDNPSGDLGVADRMQLVIEDFAKWLNIKVDNGSHSDLSAMSVGQATALTAGLILAIIGIASPLLQFVAGLPGFAHAIPGETLPSRVRFLSLGSRIVGVLLILGSLFL